MRIDLFTVRLRTVLPIVLLLFINCSGEKVLLRPDDEVGFRFGMRGDNTGIEDFIVVTTNDEIIETAQEQLLLPVSERTHHIHGPVAHGNGGYNLDWQWHFIPAEWVLVEESTEVCDVSPLYIKELLDLMPDTLTSMPFCPLHSYVKAEVR